MAVPSQQSISPTFSACEIYPRLSILFSAARSRARQFVGRQDAGHRTNPELH